MKDLFKVTPEMRGYFDHYVNRSDRILEKANELVNAILDVDKFAFNYRWNSWYTAEEAFKRHEGNCVTFSILFAALSREYGIPEKIQDVALFNNNWTKVGDHIAEVSHMNVVIMDDENREHLVDFLKIVGRPTYTSRTKKVDDAEVASIFESNLGVVEIAEGKHAEERFVSALRYARTATALGNYAVFLLVKGDYQEAEKLLDECARINTTDRIISLQAQVARKLGNTDKAERLEKKVKRYRERNPFVQYNEAVVCLRDSDLAGAEKHIKKAISIQPLRVFYELEMTIFQKEGKKADKIKRQLAELVDE